MVSVILFMSVIAFNVLVLILSPSVGLIFCPDPSNWNHFCTFLMLVQARGTCQGFRREIVGKYFWEVRLLYDKGVSPSPRDRFLASPIEGEGMFGGVKGGIWDRGVGGI